MTLLTILGVTEILRNFRLVLEGETGREIPHSSKKFGKQLCRRQLFWTIE